MPKRGENIRKRKDGRWEARIKTESGKLRSVYAKTYSELKTKLKDSNEKQKDKIDKLNKILIFTTLK